MVVIEEGAYLINNDPRFSTSTLSLLIIPATPHRPQRCNGAPRKRNHTALHSHPLPSSLLHRNLHNLPRAIDALHPRQRRLRRVRPPFPPSHHHTNTTDSSSPCSNQHCTRSSHDRLASAPHHQLSHPQSHNARRTAPAYRRRRPRTNCLCATTRASAAGSRARCTRPRGGKP